MLLNVPLAFSTSMRVQMYVEIIKSIVSSNNEVVTLYPRLY